MTDVPPITGLFNIQNKAKNSSSVIDARLRIDFRVPSLNLFKFQQFSYIVIGSEIYGS